MSSLETSVVSYKLETCNTYQYSEDIWQNTSCVFIFYKINYYF